VPSGTFCSAIASADREPLGNAVHEQHAHHEQRPAHADAAQLTDVYVMAREGATGRQQEHAARGETGAHGRR